MGVNGRNSYMGYEEDKEREELARLYPEGSAERRILNYSQGSHKEGEVPPLLFGAFKILMGISILMAIVSVVALLAEMH